MKRIIRKNTIRVVAAAVATAVGMAVLAAPQRALFSDVLASLRVPDAPADSSDSLRRASAALRLAADASLPQASKAINEALQLDARNSYLHFFNGLIYHLQARQGDSDKTDLAIEGYQQAVRFDPHNWFAHEFLGLALWEQRQYPRAQKAFAEVLLLQPGDTLTQSRMMAASYMAGDPAVACAMADQLGKNDAQTEASQLRAMAIVYASCGEFDKADAVASAFAQRSPDANSLDGLHRRLGQWRAVYRQGGDAAVKGDMLRVQYPGGQFPMGQSGGMGSVPSGMGTSGYSGMGSSGMGSSSYPGMGPSSMGGMSPGMGSGSGAFPGMGSGGMGGMGYPDMNSGGNLGMGGGFSPNGGGNVMGGGTRMVLVDVVMVRTEDTISTSRGVNLLNALTLQFGAQGSAAYSRLFSETNDTGGSTQVTRAISIPALAYSLNLANANSNLNEVLARPTLAAVEGMRSEFFSGTSLNAAVVSSGSLGSGSGVSLEKKYGVKLSIMPQILPNGMIRLAIDASRTFLKPPSANIAYTYKLEISEILANANVVMRMGDTLILGGLSEKESSNNRDGVPLLQDIPGLQYLFSQQSKTDFQRSVLILITPRPASYTWLSDATKAAIAAEGETPFTPTIDILRARYSDWFKPYPNLASVFRHLNSADLYREFRTGDVTLESWDRMNTTRERLHQALQFLYY